MTEELDAGPIIEQMVDITHFVAVHFMLMLVSSFAFMNDYFELNQLWVTMVIYLFNAF